VKFSACTLQPDCAVSPSDRSSDARGYRRWSRQHSRNLNEPADDEQQRDEHAEGNLTHCAWNPVVRLDTAAGRHSEPLIQPVPEPDLIDGRRKISECVDSARVLNATADAACFTIVVSDQQRAAMRFIPPAYSRGARRSSLAHKKRLLDWNSTLLCVRRCRGRSVE
jgi:hypothetical protein